MLSNETLCEHAAGLHVSLLRFCDHFSFPLPSAMVRMAAVPCSLLPYMASSCPSHQPATCLHTAGASAQSMAPLTGSHADQVRLWRSERSKEDILRFMRVSGGDELMAQRQDMIAYWDFNEPDDDRQGFLPPRKA